jgi:hypothetical protein
MNQMKAVLDGKEFFDFAQSNMGMSFSPFGFSNSRYL